MRFVDFAKKIGSVLKGTSSQAAFLKTLFEAIIPDEEEWRIEDIKESTWKGYYQGNSISRVAKTIVAVADPMCFEEYINTLGDSAMEKLCAEFSEEIPDMDLHNAGKLIAELFDRIIQQAAEDSEKKDDEEPVVHEGPLVVKPVYLPDITAIAKAFAYAEDLPIVDPFQGYIEKAKARYSLKKTLLYLESPQPFYSMYVCNDLQCYRFPGSHFKQLGTVRTNATVSILEEFSKYSIIQGTGGIGKSMFLTYLFLSSAKEYKAGERLPVLVLLKDYKENYSDLEEFIHKGITDFAPDVSREDLIKRLNTGDIILLLDGLDEIRSQLKESFDSNLESFTKRYPGCTIVLSSRPITDFVSYSLFTVYDILPLRKEQAVELVSKLDFWDKEGQTHFISDLENRLYSSHREFASNPLLLTIMLMTYSYHGDIPAKMHKFYEEAYKTMARLHDNTKGSFKRPFYTGLDPERFAVYFSAFCARTYIKEQLEFTSEEFAEHMKKAIKDVPVDDSDTGATLSPSAFLRDLVENLCIMYGEGGKYYFIHRSFQEYFAAKYFISDEAVLYKAGLYFDAHDEAMYCDRVIDMLYDMAAERVERLVFFPCLQKRFEEYGRIAPNEYLGFLFKEYPALYFNEGIVEDPESLSPDSLLFANILHTKRLWEYCCLEGSNWPFSSIFTVLEIYYWVYCAYREGDSDKEDVIQRSLAVEGDDMILVSREELSSEYIDLFGFPDEAGRICFIEVKDLIENLNEQNEVSQELYKYLSSEEFPLYKEFCAVKDYYDKLAARIEKKKNSISLFDD